MRALFATDLHGRIDRYEKLFRRVRSVRPAALFLGGDLLPGPLLALAAPDARHEDFVGAFLVPEFQALKQELGEDYPRVFVILGNDDGCMEEPAILDGAVAGCWTYVHDRRVTLADGTAVYGYAYVPPTPFQLKDWERYDVSRYVDPGCVSPEAGCRSRPEPEHVTRYATIAEDLDRLAGGRDHSRSVFLFHAPPYRTALDRAALDGRMVDHVPLDVHVGSIAIRRFIEQEQPHITLHGHVHESCRITGCWHDRIGRTHLFGGAHDGPELALVSFDTREPGDARRELL